MQDAVPHGYTPSTLQDRYAIELGEAERLIASFGADRKELDMLLGARNRKQGMEEVRVAA